MIMPSWSCQFIYVLLLPVQVYLLYTEATIHMRGQYLVLFSFSNFENILNIIFEKLFKQVALEQLDGAACEGRTDGAPEPWDGNQLHFLSSPFI
jgi:hypothetical protein